MLVSNIPKLVKKSLFILMRILIITINILLLSLILYNVLSRGDKLLENLEKLLLKNQLNIMH